MRRANVALIYSQGFNPRPKIQLAAGLPLGYESVCEVVDFWLAEPVASRDALRARIASVSPDGLIIHNAETVDVNAPALQSITARAIYRVAFKSAIDKEAVARLVREFLSKSECLRIRRDKTYDLRQLVDDLRLAEGADAQLEMTLALSPRRGTARADEVLEALGINPLTTLITRVRLEFEDETLSQDD